MAGAETLPAAAGVASPTPRSTPIWLCGPDAATDHCLIGDGRTTLLEPDGSSRVRSDPVATEPGVDCFYVYPTVHVDPVCGNAAYDPALSAELFAVRNQATPLARACRVFAPFYAQVVHCGTRRKLDPSLAADMHDLAYADVRDAFLAFRATHGRDRPFVVVGHSQGADLLARLLQEEIQPHPAHREHLAKAVLLGSDTRIPKNATQVAGVPLCQTAGEAGCAIAFRSFSAEHPPVLEPDVDASATDTPCTAPSSWASGEGLLREVELPSLRGQAHPAFPLAAMSNGSLPDVETPYLSFPRFYRAECRKDAAGDSYLAVWPSGGPQDERADPIAYDTPFFNPAAYGTRLLDFQWVLGDLIHEIRGLSTAMEGSMTPR